MPPTQRKRAGDLTGRTAEKLAEENAELLRERENEISLTRQAAAEAKDDVIDVETLLPDPDADDEPDEPSDGLVAPPAPEQSFVRQPEPVAQPTEVTHSPGVTVERTKVTFRVNSKVENMTYGAGNNYSFDEGQRYSGSQDLYNHLDALGLIYH